MSVADVRERFRLSRFMRGEAASEAPVRLGHRRIFILPTLRGLGFALLAALLFFIAFVYDNNLVYLLSFFLASLFFITTVHTFRSLSGLVVRAGQAKPVFAGETAAFPLHIDNPSALVRPRIGVAGQPGTELELLPESRSLAFVHRPALRRGWCEAGTVTLYSAYPLGLFRAWSPLRFDQKALVYPRPSQADVAPPFAPGAAAEGALQKGSEDFYGLKSYMPGDSIRHIHWKAYAKGHGVHSKQYGSGSGGDLRLDFEATPGGDAEERLSLLCRWVIEADRAGLNYGLRLPGFQREPAAGMAHFHACLEALALCRP